MSLPASLSILAIGVLITTLMTPGVLVRRRAGQHLLGQRAGVGLLGRGQRQRARQVDIALEVGRLRALGERQVLHLAGALLGLLFCARRSAPCSTTCFSAARGLLRSMAIGRINASDQPKKGIFSSSRLSRMLSCGNSVARKIVSQLLW